MLNICDLKHLTLNAKRYIDTSTTITTLSFKAVVLQPALYQ